MGGTLLEGMLDLCQVSTLRIRLLVLYQAGNQVHTGYGLKRQIHQWTYQEVIREAAQLCRLAFHRGSQVIEIGHIVRITREL